MKYDHKFTISSVYGVGGQLYIKLQRTNGYLLIRRDCWDKLKMQRRKTIINKWRKK